MISKPNKTENKNKYKIGDEITLCKKMLLHDFIYSEYFGKNSPQQQYCICFWKVKNNIKLSKYIDNYSSDTIYLINKFTEKKQIYIPYSLDVKYRIEIFDKINTFINRIEFIKESKENYFMPSLTKLDDYIEFILNIDEIDKVLLYDIYTGNIDINILKTILPKWVINNTILKRNSTRVDREISLIYGCIVGRLIENDISKLKYIKQKFPNIFISNLDGKVIY